MVRAALAPAQPSAQDRRVAAQAQAAKAKALIELQQKRQDEAEAHGEGDDTATDPAARVAGDAYAAVADALNRGPAGPSIWWREDARLYAAARRRARNVMNR